MFDILTKQEGKGLFYIMLCLILLYQPEKQMVFLKLLLNGKVFP